MPELSDTVVIASPSDAGGTVAEIQATGARAAWVRTDAPVEALTHILNVSSEHSLCKPLPVPRSRPAGFPQPPVRTAGGLGCSGCSCLARWICA